MKKIVISILGVIIILFVYFFKDLKRGIRQFYISRKYGMSYNDGSCPKCAFLFTDGISKQAKAYQNEGISPQDTDEALTQLYKKGKLVKVNANDALQLAYMPHSKPYVLPKCKSFIDMLTQEYEDSCKTNKMPLIPIVFSSGTRSVEGVKRLQKQNKNSIKESAHLRGKTFDINYRQFGKKNKQQVEVFVKILNKYNKENRCFVKFEQNGCLHITVN